MWLCVVRWQTLNWKTTGNSTEFTILTIQKKKTVKQFMELLKHSQIQAGKIRKWFKSQREEVFQYIQRYVHMYFLVRAQILFIYVGPNDMYVVFILKSMENTKQKVYRKIRCRSHLNVTVCYSLTQLPSNCYAFFIIFITNLRTEM